MKQKNDVVIKRGSTLFLKLALIAIAFVVGMMCIFLLPAIFENWSYDFPQIPQYRELFVYGVGLTVIPFYYALTRGWDLLTLIDKDQAFSAKSVKALRQIKYSAIVIAVLYAAQLVVIYNIAQIEDAPGLILYYSAIFIGGPLIVSTAAAILERLLFDALKLKKENDLTV